MKKILLCLLICLTACTAQEKGKLVAEKFINKDMDSANCPWVESYVVLKEYIDSPEISDTIVNIMNVFQSPDKSLVYTHTNTEDICDTAHFGKRLALNPSLINISFKGALDLLLATGYPKPHSKCIVLRRENDTINPQYYFGEVSVDAYTGDVIAL